VRGFSSFFLFLGRTSFPLPVRSLVQVFLIQPFRHSELTQEFLHLPVPASVFFSSPLRSLFSFIHSHENRAVAFSVQVAVPFLIPSLNERGVWLYSRPASSSLFRSVWRPAFSLTQPFQFFPSKSQTHRPRPSFSSRLSLSPPLFSLPLLEVRTT